jgi:hypothetical protein
MSNEEQYPTSEALFKSSLSQAEIRRADKDSRARSILESEKLALDTKTQRLRAARLQRDNLA